MIFMIAKEKIESHIPEAVRFLREGTDTVLAYIYGSYVTGRLTPHSDLDIAILLKPGLSREEMGRQDLYILGQLADIFHTDNVDSRVINSYPLSMRWQVLKYGRLLLSCDEEVRVDFETSIIRDYFDIKPYWDEYSKYFLERITGNKMNINIESLERRLEKLKDYITYLKKMRSLSLEEIKGDLTKRYSLERCLQLAIECCLDMANHIISCFELGRPESLSDIFLAMGKAGYFDMEYAKMMADMARLKNRLVHFYLDIDVDKLYDYLQNDVVHLEKFGRIVGIIIKDNLEK